MKLPFKSIRWQLQAWHGLVLLLVAVGFCAPAYRLALDNQMQRIDKELSLMERTLVRSLMENLHPEEKGLPLAERKPPSFLEFIQKLKTTPLTLPPAVEERFAGTSAGYTYFSIWDGDGKVLLQSPNAPDISRPPPPKGEEITEQTRTVDQRRELLRSSPLGISILVGRDSSPDRDELRRMNVNVLLTVTGVWLLGWLGGWWLAGRALRPIDAISHTAARISEGNLKERINVTDTANELGGLCGVLNQTFERLDTAFERQRQFTSDASHELRTPLAILISETQRILKRERTPEEYREVIQTCQTAATSMSELVESLLLLARQDSEAAEKHHEPCDLAPLSLDVVTTHTPLASEKNIEVVCSLQSALCLGDPVGLRILISNLVANAIQHHQGGGHVWPESGIKDGDVFLRVRDDGPGIPADDLPRIFERFYRVDKARSRTEGHSGLGLSIVKAIADNHGAQIAVTAESGGGTTFELRMPRLRQNGTG